MYSFYGNICKESLVGCFSFLLWVVVVVVVARDESISNERSAFVGESETASGAAARRQCPLEHLCDRNNFMNFSKIRPSVFHNCKFSDDNNKPYSDCTSTTDLSSDLLSRTATHSATKTATKTQTRATVLFDAEKSLYVVASHCRRPPLSFGPLCDAETSLYTDASMSLC